MNVDDKGDHRRLTKTANGVFLGYLLVIVLLNVPGISIRYIRLISSSEYLQEGKFDRGPKDDETYPKYCPFFALITSIL
jgi:hypothetical protein